MVPGHRFITDKWPTTVQSVCYEVKVIRERKRKWRATSGEVTKVFWKKKPSTEKLFTGSLPPTLWGGRALPARRGVEREERGRRTAIRGALTLSLLWQGEKPTVWFFGKACYLNVGNFMQVGKMVQGKRQVEMGKKYWFNGDKGLSKHTVRLSWIEVRVKIYEPIKMKSWIELWDYCKRATWA